MKTNNIDTLLRKSLCKEFCAPPDLDKATWQKMQTVHQKERSFLLIPASIVSFLLLLLEIIILLSFLNHEILKIIILSLFCSSICVLVFYTIILFNINLKRIL